MAFPQGYQTKAESQGQFLRLNPAPPCPQLATGAAFMSGPPPFGEQVILNGYEYVAVAAWATGIGFTKGGGYFTGIADAQFLAQVAQTLSQHAPIGRLGQVCHRWIYSACLPFRLDLAGQQRSGFRCGCSVYRAEYGPNLLFASGGQLEHLFNRVLDR